MAEILEFLSSGRNLALFALLVICVAAPVLVSQIKPVFGLGKYTIISLFPFAMLAAALLDRFGDRLAVSVCLCALVLGVSFHFVRRQIIVPSHSDRTSAQYMLHNAAVGDLLIFTSLSLPAIHYYLRLMRPDHGFSEITFPSELSSHLGWMDARRMLEDRSKLEREAGKLALLAELSVRNGKAVWVFYGYDTEIGEILKTALDQRLPASETRVLKGSFFNKVIVYGKTAATNPDGSARVRRRGDPGDILALCSGSGSVVRFALSNSSISG